MNTTSGYLHDKNIRYLHASAKQWQSEATFYADEIHFLRLLIDKYLIWLAPPAHRKIAVSLAGRLKRFESQQEILQVSINGYMKRLAMMEKKHASSNKADLKKHIDLENDMIGFARSLNALKRGIFDLTERVSRANKTRDIDKLIGSGI